MSEMSQLEERHLASFGEVLDEALRSGGRAVAIACARMWIRASARFLARHLGTAQAFEAVSREADRLVEEDVAAAGPVAFGGGFRGRH